MPYLPRISQWQLRLRSLFSIVQSWSIFIRSPQTWDPYRWPSLNFSAAHPHRQVFEDITENAKRVRCSTGRL